jgi:hypothetical protein
MPGRGVRLRLYPLWVLSPPGYHVVMALVGFARVLRWHLLLTVAVVAVVLSLLAMHELSFGHTVAQPRSASPALSPHDHHRPTGIVQAEGPVSVEPGTHDGCAGCQEHHLLMLGCLIALILLVTGWLLRGPPAAGHQAWIAPAWRPEPLPYRHRPVARTWVELSVSRT